jgi:quercetin dioxygenase-like cupin family protein
MEPIQIKKNAAVENKGESFLQSGQSFNLVELIKYNEGSVVSRTLVSNDAGTVTLFAFDEGQGLSEHTAPFDALVHVVDGESEVIIDGKPNKVSAGELILMPANIPHALKANKQFKMILTMLRKKF